MKGLTVNYLPKITKFDRSAILPRGRSGQVLSRSLINYQVLHVTRDGGPLNRPVCFCGMEIEIDVALQSCVNARPVCGKAKSKDQRI
jgi:hypothetical protein